MKYYLAVDIGASSGRHILGSIVDNKLSIEEVYRFENSIKSIDGKSCWDIKNLFNEIKNGIKKCKEINKIPESISIDTWAVDFVLLDSKDNIIGNAVSYRDDRTEGIMEEAFKVIKKEDIYKSTGIQFQRFNTLYQLLAIKKENPQILDNAKTFLMIPDYINSLLTGVKVNEYTNATSTQLVNVETKNWDESIINSYNLNKDIFQEIKMPKSSLGYLKRELIEEFGFDMEVILPATHDTGSAFISSVCNDEDTIYLSSGTWSLIGIESNNPICTEDALHLNFTNEGGIDYRFRFLKNIMGLWILQQVRKNLNNKYSFSQFVELAKSSINFNSVINVDDNRFLNPKNMIEEIQNYCKESNQQIPVEIGEIIICVLRSLAKGYAEAVISIENIKNKKFKRINIFGGGCQNDLLNQLVADATGKEVLSGPTEATAIGNLTAQLLCKHIIKDLGEARELIKESFEIKYFNKVGV